ncbi:DgyrCDS13877 [Dimorphilus gyrociliatus]|uniref:peptidylglycine monooxygenase n=1 Tax=Dimorphilus gyrociliatus TaxID=2664684 RepID=A0A7I8WC17_9ANNE|nr:DgyrCDS13877 [Dimorphilus gyrociliatus]
MWILISLAVVCLTSGFEFDVRMPNVKPQERDTYLCKQIKMGELTEYITKFRPHAKAATAHHMLLYSCIEPGSDEEVWDCGEMMQRKSTHYNKAPVCQSGSKIIYAWAMNAGDLKLPNDVSFAVGGNTESKYLVLQVHYKSVEKFLSGKYGDNSGIIIEASPVPTNHLAGVYLMGTGGEIKPHSITYMETACLYKEPENVVMYPFAYRVHAHTHGRVVSGYRIRNGIWTEIGRMDPRQEEMFYNISSPRMTIKRGDVLAARCTMENLDNDKTVRIGMTQDDEMCNFYIMYYLNANQKLSSDNCWTPGPPNYYWNFPAADAVPESASTHPKTKQHYSSN